MTKQIPDEIKAGMDLLDEEFPGWREIINPEQLDMGDCHQCILGQLFGEYFTGKREMGLTGTEPEEFGFEDWVGGNDRYQWITAAWKEALT